MLQLLQQSPVMCSESNFLHDSYCWCEPWHKPACRMLACQPLHWQKIIRHEVKLPLAPRSCLGSHSPFFGFCIAKSALFVLNLKPTMPAGRALAAIPWLQTKWGLGFRIWNCGLFSIARYHAFWFVGAYSRWVPIPNPTRLIPTWSNSFISGVASWMHVPVGVGSHAVKTLPQHAQSGPAFWAGIQSLMQVRPALMTRLARTMFMCSFCSCKAD